MSAAPVALKRQWIPITGGSCDVRMGAGALDAAATLFKAAVGSPKRCMVVLRASDEQSVGETLRRQLVNVGFEVSWHVLGEGRVCSLNEALVLSEAFAAHGITADDLCCAYGDAQVLSLCSYVCAHWCGTTTLVAIPTNEIALLEGSLVPSALDVAGKRGIMAAPACARHALVDYDLVLSAPGSASATYARALMVAAAMCGSERAFSDLWDGAEGIAAGDEEALVAQLMATAKSRGQTLSSTAAAVRQSLGYGQSFANALAHVTKCPLERGLLVAEGMRFSARLSVGLEKLSVDDMLAQDELLETLGVDGVTCDVRPDELVAALKDELLTRGNRAMQLVPLSIGRVRLATIPDDLLLEHAGAWCAVHAA